MPAIEHITAVIEAALMDAYQEGFEAGRLAMRDSILRAASGEAIASPPPAIVSAPKKFYGGGPDIRAPLASEDEKPRAPKGTVSLLLERALSESPGSTTTALEEWVTKGDPRVAAKSVGNELRRFEGKKYHRMGRLWFLVPTASAEGDASSTGVSTPTSDDIDRFLWGYPRDGEGPLKDNGTNREEGAV